MHRNSENIRTMWKMTLADGSVVSMNDEVHGNFVADEESGSSGDNLELRINRIIRDSERRMQAKIDKLESQLMEPKILKRFNAPESVETNDDSGQWHSIGQEFEIAGKISGHEMDKESFKFAEDVYAILVSAKWNTSPFWFSLVVIFLFQSVGSASFVLAVCMDMEIRYQMIDFFIAIYL